MAQPQSDGAGALAALEARFGNQISFADSVREQHGHTTTWIENQPPDAVLFAQDTQDVCEAVKICAAHKFPVIGFGTGTSLEGHVNAPYGGLCVDMTAMDEMITLYTDDMAVRVQPGVTRNKLNELLRDTGLFFPIDPGADASLGGMAATRASGTNAVRYGTMKDVVLSLEVVTANGDIIETGTRAKKSAAGYDLTRLFVGSEGGLGLITGLTLRLFGQPEQVAGGVCGFPSIDAACQVAMQAIQYGIPMARIELLDAMTVRACNAYSKLDLAEQPTLFIEFHGSEAGIAEQVELFEEIARDNGATNFDWTTDPAARKKLWQARHDAYWAASALRPGSRPFSTDACVPISRLAECVAETQMDIEALSFPAAIVGHVGDGNFHVLLLVDMDSEQEVAEGEAFSAKLSQRAIRMDGTCTGEHGIGQGKAKYLADEKGPAFDMMRTIKQALDPDNIMNPGKWGF